MNPENVNISEVHNLKLVDTFGTTIMEGAFFNDGSTLTFIINKSKPKVFEPHNTLGQPITDEEYMEVMSLNREK